MDQRTARELARIMGEPDPLTAVEARCARRGRAQDAHLVLSAHPLGGKEFLVIRHPGSATGRERDADQWQRGGPADPDAAGFKTLGDLDEADLDEAPYDSAMPPDLDEAGFAPLPLLAKIVFGPDADSARELLGEPAPALACRCGIFLLGPELADRIHAALTDWYVESLSGPCKPKKVIAT